MRRAMYLALSALTLGMGLAFAQEELFLQAAVSFYTALWLIEYKEVEA